MGEVPSGQPGARELLNGVTPRGGVLRGRTAVCGSTVCESRLVTLTADAASFAQGPQQPHAARGGIKPI